MPPHQGVWGAPQPPGKGVPPSPITPARAPRGSVATAGTGGALVWGVLCCAPHSGPSSPESQREGWSRAGGTAQGTAGTPARGQCCASRGQPGEAGPPFPRLHWPRAGREPPANILRTFGESQTAREGRAAGGVMLRGKSSHPGAAGRATTHNPQPPGPVPQFPPGAPARPPGAAESPPLAKSAGAGRSPRPSGAPNLNKAPTSSARGGTTAKSPSVPRCGGPGVPGMSRAGAG